MAKFYKVTRFNMLDESTIDDIMNCGVDCEVYDDDEAATTVGEAVDIFKAENLLDEIGEDTIKEWLNKNHK